jgi:O-acetylhomoserine (thiol)-lyase
MDQYSFTTRALHTRYSKPDVHGALRMPVYDTAAFEYNTAEELEQAFNGTTPGHVYSRLTNPTVEHFENVLTSLTNSLGCIAFSSGMAAISNLILAIMSQGDNIITSHYLFGNTYSLLNSVYRSVGIEPRFIDITNPAEVEQNIDDNTRAIFFETITNPQLEVVNIETLRAIAQKHNLPLIADTTLTPPCIFNSKNHGVDVEIISNTKYISGGGTSMGGVIIDNGTFEWERNGNIAHLTGQYGSSALLMKLRKEIAKNLGACLSPHNAFMQTLGLETLMLRATKSCENTIHLAKYLENHPGVKTVNYPGLKTSGYFETSKQQFSFAGAILTFDLDSKEACYRFMNKLNIIRKATNLNDNKTLIIHPSSTIFCEFDPQTKEKLGVRDTMMRMAVGIEDIHDLKDDIEKAINN